ncbi:MAG: alginate export family protein [Nitrospirae bacterium]|nr:alginate export family protein [Nitrospirota bacterium]
MRMKRGQTGWAALVTSVSAAAMTVGLALISAPVVQAAFELPEGERITNVPAIPRAIPQKEAYELYDPKIGKNFDISKFWIRADLRVRPEYRNMTCFGVGIAGGNCNTINGTGGTTAVAGKANDQFIMQMTRLGIGYDLSPDVNFYMEIIDSRVWGGGGQATGAGGAGNNGDPLTHTCGATPGPNGSACSLGVRAAYMLIRNFAGIEGFSVKAGRQYVIFGDHSLFGHFDWANTGYSHDGIMLQYSTKAIDTYVGWFRQAETDLAQGSAVGSVGPNLATATGQGQNAAGDSDMLILYNQIKSIPWILLEPYYVYYRNNLGAADIRGQGLGTAKHSDQTRHMLGTRIAMKKGGFDWTSEGAYQFGSMGDSAAAASNLCGQAGGNGKCIHINAFATRNWIGYTVYEWAWKPRLAINFDYASGDGRANCTLNGAYGPCRTANTFENFFPTNHIHMGYMDVQAWKNMASPSGNLQLRPSKNSHLEVWYTHLNLANAKDNWYRASQGVYVFSKANNTKTHIGDEIDVVGTYHFMDGKVAAQAGYGHLFPGAYISANLGQQARGQDWAYGQMWINF